MATSHVSIKANKNPRNAAEKFAFHLSTVNFLNRQKVERKTGNAQFFFQQR